MKIIHLINSLQADGGAENLLLEIANLQILMGYQVKIVVFLKKEPNLYDRAHTLGIEIISLKKDTKYSLTNLFSLRKIILREKPNILHTHLFPSQYLAILATLGIQVKLVTTEHNTWNRRRKFAFLKPLERLIYSQYDKIICISNATKDNLVTYIGNKIENKCLIIENGINLAKYKPKMITAITNKSIINLVMVARFNETKDHRTVIYALLDLPDNIKLTFIGDGVLKVQIEQLISKLELSKRVTFLGVRKDILMLLTTYDIGILSSNFDGFGIAAVELMASGLPVIVSDVEGLAQIVENYGLLFKKGDSKDLAQKIMSLVQDQDLFKRVSNKCINRAQDFNIQFTVEKYDKLYKSE